MHINWTSAVTLPEYPSGRMQADLRRRIAEANDDDLLAAYLHWTEGRVAVEWFQIAGSVEEEAERERDHARALVVPTSHPFTDEYARARDELLTVLQVAIYSADKAQDGIRDIWRQLSDTTRSDLTARYRDATDEPAGKIEPLGPIRSSMDRTWETVRTALRKHQNLMHDLALREEVMDRFLKSEASVPMEQIHHMTPPVFEQTVAALAERDGYQLLRSGGGARDLGADVIAVTQEGLRVVMQCKHRQGGRGKVGSPDIQTLNGTARPEHQADVVVAVTNGTFTKPASDFARNHDIHLLDETKLKRWGTWGEPLLAVLGLQENPPTLPAHCESRLQRNGFPVVR
ncbi:restriction endonuclease [Streptomyces hydrogenans]